MTKSENDALRRRLAREIVENARRAIARRENHRREHARATKPAREAAARAQASVDAYPNAAPSPRVRESRGKVCARNMLTGGPRCGFEIVGRPVSERHEAVTCPRCRCLLQAGALATAGRALMHAHLDDPDRATNAVTHYTLAAMYARTGDYVATGLHAQWAAENVAGAVLNA